MLPYRYSLQLPASWCCDGVMSRVPTETSQSVICVRACDLLLLLPLLFRCISSLIFATFPSVRDKCCYGAVVLLEVQYVFCTNLIYRCLLAARSSLSAQRVCAHPGRLIRCLPAAVAPFDSGPPSTARPHCTVHNASLHFALF